MVENMVAKIKSNLVFISAVLLLTACSASQNLDKVSSDTDSMDKKMDSMDKNLTQMTKVNTELAKTLKPDNSDLKQISTTMTKIANQGDQTTSGTAKSLNQLNASLEKAANAQNIGGASKVLQLETFRLSKQNARMSALQDLKNAKNQAALTTAAGRYVCEFEFRIWTPELAQQATADQLTALAIQDYLSKIADYSLDEGADFAIQSFADTDKSMAQLNMLVRLLKFTGCPQQKAPENKMNFFSMIVDALTHEKLKAPLSETDKVILGELRPAAILSLQIYHNLMMSAAVKMTLQDSHQHLGLFNPTKQSDPKELSLTQTWSDIHKTMTKFMVSETLGLNSWKFDLSAAPDSRITQITSYAVEAIKIKSQLKHQFKIEPLYDSFLTDLLNEMALSEDVQQKPAGKHLFTIMHDQYQTDQH